MKYGLGMQIASLSALPGNDDAIRCLSVLGSFDLDDLLMRGWKFENGGAVWFGRDLPETWLTPHKRRLAPGKLVSDGNEPFHRGPWQLNVFDCDLEGGEKLIDTCPQCGVELSWINACTIFNCQGCGFDLRHVPATNAQAPELEIARRFFALYCGDFELPSPFDAMDFRSVCYGMEWFAHFRSIWMGQFLTATVQNALFGLEALELWPVSFEIVVRDFFRRDPRIASLISSKAEAAPVWALLQLIDRAQTPELHDALKERALPLFEDRYPSNATSSRETSRHWLAKMLHRPRW
jgi:hypothetical protein